MLNIFLTLLLIINFQNTHFPKPLPWVCYIPCVVVCPCEGAGTAVNGIEDIFPITYWGDVRYWGVPIYCPFLHILSLVALSLRLCRMQCRGYCWTAIAARLSFLPWKVCGTLLSRLCLPLFYSYTAMKYSPVFLTLIVGAIPSIEYTRPSCGFSKPFLGGTKLPICIILSLIYLYH